MADFNSSFGFTRFQHAVAHETRYVFGAEVQRFLQTVVETSSNRMRPLSKDEILRRDKLQSHEAAIEGRDPLESTARQWFGGSWGGGCRVRSPRTAPSRTYETSGSFSIRGSRESEGYFVPVPGQR